MPMYDYVCDKDGEFEYIKSLSERSKAPCPKCGEACPLKAVQGTNEFAAKTKYIPPPKATRKLGDKGTSPARRGKWV